MKRHRRTQRRRRWAKWRERYEVLAWSYRCIYAVVWGVAMLGAAFQWTTTEAGLEQTAQISLGVAIVAAIVFVVGVLTRRAVIGERSRKRLELERRWQERPAAHRQVHQPGPGRPAGRDHPTSPPLPNSPDVAP